MRTDTGEFWQNWLELLPDPLGEVLAGGVLQPWDVVQVVVIEQIIDRLEDRFDFGEVANPAGVRVYLTLNVNGRTE